jgi:hypothetical protein
MSDNRGYAKFKKLKGISLLKFWTRIRLSYWKADLKLAQTLRKKKCYYGPFKGEFGHFLAHNLPFLMYLHKNGVKIIYCGMELHKPFMVDEKGNSIVSEWRVLRDFFAEVTPDSNSTVPPTDVQAEIEKFENEARQSELPFWNIGDDYYYWFIHRNWLLEKGHVYIYDLSRVYKTKDENACVIFPRKKGVASPNNGEPWDYQQVIDSILPYFDKIYICGHPSQVIHLNTDHPKVEFAVSTDNSVMLGKISNARLIITQHSGIVYVGEYVHRDVMVIYKGGKQVQDIGSFHNTLRFKQQFKGYSKIHLAFTREEIISNLKPSL